MHEADAPPRRHFIQEIIERDIAAGKWGPPGDSTVIKTRFPPEPNGYLHVGHGKSICLNYGLAAQYGGTFRLRFDDTNPVKEEQEYVEAIIADVRWLGARWPGMRGADGPPGRTGKPGRGRPGDGDPAAPSRDAGVLYSSDYFRQMYDYAVELIRKGKAYVDDLSAEEIREYRGTLTSPGRNSPCRARSVEENLDLFERMRRGEFPDGSKVLRAKIDMASPNMNLRDPVMYRILHARHHRTGEAWCVYPMYDWAHGLEDSIEGITHSLCTLEFENHRPLYDWFIDAINEGRTDDGSGPWGKRIHHPQQIEFARLNVSHTVMSKRKLLELVREGHVRGWDDPRMPTLRGLRRRGYTPEALRDFCTRVGVAKFNGLTEVALLEHCIRDDLNRRAPRVMCVMRPLRVVITNWEGGRQQAAGGRQGSGIGDRGSDGSREQGTGNREQAGAQASMGVPSATPDADWLTAVNNPEDESAGTRLAPFSGVLYIERDDFMEDPPRKFFRLAPGREVRLRYGYFITCNEVVKDERGEIVELRCTYDPATRGGDAPDGRKVKATLHWVSAAHAVDAEVRLYEHLFTKADPEADDWRNNLNPDSLKVLSGCKLEPNWRDAAAAGGFADGVLRLQFERQGYFCLDPDSTPDRPVFNRTVTLKDTWAKIAQRGG